MKVFTCISDSIRGRVIVAADSALEAKQAISQYIYWEALYKETDFSEIKNLEYKGTTPGVLFEYHDDCDEPENKNIKVEWNSKSLKIELV